MRIVEHVSVMLITLCGLLLHIIKLELIFISPTSQSYLCAFFLSHVIGAMLIKFVFMVFFCANKYSYHRVLAMQDGFRCRLICRSKFLRFTTGAWHLKYVSVFLYFSFSNCCCPWKDFVQWVLSIFLVLQFNALMKNSLSRQLLLCFFKLSFVTVVVIDDVVRLPTQDTKICSSFDQSINHFRVCSTYFHIKCKLSGAVVRIFIFSTILISALKTVQAVNVTSSF